MARIARTARALQRDREPSGLRPGGVRCFGVRPAADSATSSANRRWRVSSRLALTTHHVAAVRKDDGRDSNQAHAAASARKAASSAGLNAARWRFSYE